MNTHQLLERIESLLECLLAVAKIQATETVRHVETHKGAHITGTEGHTREMYEKIRAANPIEYPEPAPENDSDSTAGKPNGTGLYDPHPPGPFISSDR